MLEKDSNRRMDSIKLYESLLVLYLCFLFSIYKHYINYCIVLVDQTWLRYIGINNFGIDFRDHFNKKLF